MPVEARKSLRRRQGRRRAEAPLAEPIEIGLFTAEPGRGAFDRSERHPDGAAADPQRARRCCSFVTDRQPTHAGVDPYNFYIDRNSDDNVGAVTG